MAFISVFDVLGPNMIGPSSSHTAGAEIIAFLAQKMIAPPLKRVDFTLYGSFAKTYHGHGTDRALLGGIMGFSTDDTRIRNSFSIATERGLSYSFTPCETETDVHPNTVDIRMENVAGQVRIKLDKGNVMVVGRQSPTSLYDQDLVTFEEGVQAYDHKDAAGFIKLQCEGTETGRGSARLAPASLAAAMARSTAATLPAITTCPGELKFTASTTSPCAAWAQMACT